MVSTRQRKHSLFRVLWLPVLTVAYLGYFGFHAFNGQYGLGALTRLEAEEQRVRAELDTVKEEYARLEGRAARLRPSSLDLDLIDELARHNLNLLHPDEIVLQRNMAR